MPADYAASVAAARRTRSAKVLPDPPDAPGRWDPAPAAVEGGALWDGVEAGPATHVPEHVAGLDVRESRWVDADLSGRRFTDLRCRDLQFEHCDLSGAVLDGAVLDRVAFTNCRLTGTVLSGAALTDVRISDCRADLVSLRMARAKFLLVENTVLRGADFYELTGTGCAMVGCDLTGASFGGARLTELRLHGSGLDDISGALSLRGARISAEQLLTLGAAVLAALDIQVTNAGVA
jgi:uncharacterized protein YjbI with pentapeptide repeats